MNDASLQLSAEFRVLRTARLLPKGELSQADIDAVRTRFESYAREKHLSPGVVAKAVGCPPHVITQWRKGGGDVADAQNITRKMNDWLEAHARAVESRLTIEYVPTRVAQDFIALCKTACATGSMLAAAMPSGSGKTLVLQALAQRLSGFYIYCDHDLSPRDFLIAISEAIGVRLSGSLKASLSAAEIKRRIVARLRGTGRPLFLDEAHALPRECFAGIRSIHDQTGVTIVMAGTTGVFSAIDDDARDKGQMSSRCLRYNALDMVFSAEDDPRESSRLGRSLYTIEEVKALADSWQVRFTGDGLSMAWALACLPERGTLRTVRRVVELVKALHPGEAVSREFMLEAMPLLFGAVGTSIAALADRHLETMHTRTREAA